MTVSEDEPAEAITHEIAEKMRKIDRGRGVIIITDQSIIPKHSSLISKHFSGKYTIVEDMTIQTDRIDCRTRRISGCYDSVLQMLLIH